MTVAEARQLVKHVYEIGQPEAKDGKAADLAELAERGMLAGWEKDGQAFYMVTDEGKRFIGVRTKTKPVLD